MAVNTELLNIIDACYTKSQLEQVHLQLIVPAIAQNPGLRQVSDEVARYYNSLEAPGNQPKGLYVGLLAGILADADALKAYMQTQPEGVQILLERLIWLGKIPADQLYREWNILPVINAGDNPTEQKSFYTSRPELDTPFLFFPSNAGQVYKFNRLVFHLPFEIRKKLQAHFPKPRDYDLKPAKPVYHTDHIYENKGRILSLLPLIDLYHKQGHIKLTQNGKPQSTTLGKMQKSLRIEEFFDKQQHEKPFIYLRTQLLTGLWLSGESLSDLTDPQQLIRELFRLYRSGAYSGAENLLVHLKGGAQSDPEQDTEVAVRLWTILRELPLEEWVDAESFYSWFQYRGIDLQPVQVSEASHTLYLALKAGQRSNNRIYIESHTYDQGVLKPYIRATFFLFAAFGLVDIAFDLPDTREPGNSYFSPFDGLRYVRLTKLGAFVLGLRDSYSVQVTKPVVAVNLSSDALIMRVSGKQEGLMPVLENFARKISSTRFRVDYESFLKGCSDAADIESKIRLFEEQVSDTYPPNWSAFFSELRRKSKQLTTVKDTVVFRLQDSDRELATLIAQDDVLKGMIVKAEGFHIILQKRNLSRFKNRLKSFGYLL